MRKKRLRARGPANQYSTHAAPLSADSTHFSIHFTPCSPDSTLGYQKSPLISPSTPRMAAAKRQVRRAVKEMLLNRRTNETATPEPVKPS